MIEPELFKTRLQGQQLSREKRRCITRGCIDCSGRGYVLQRDHCGHAEPVKCRLCDGKGIVVERIRY